MTFRLPSKQPLPCNGNTSLIYSVQRGLYEIYTIEPMKPKWLEKLGLIDDYDSPGAAIYRGRIWDGSSWKKTALRLDVFRYVIPRLKFIHDDTNTLDLLSSTCRMYSVRWANTDKWIKLLESKNESISKAAQFALDNDPYRITPDFNLYDFAEIDGEMVCVDPYFSEVVGEVACLHPG